MSGWMSRVLCLAAMVAVAAPATPAWGQTDVGKVNALIGDLKNPDFVMAYGAAEQLRKYPQYRAQIVKALLEALTTGDWNRCGGDMRDNAGPGARRVQSKGSGRAAARAGEEREVDRARMRGVRVLPAGRDASRCACGADV